MSASTDHRALFVLTSHGTLGSTGRATGYTVSEAADPWAVLTEAGWTVDARPSRVGARRRTGWTTRRAPRPGATTAPCRPSSTPRPRWPTSTRRPTTRSSSSAATGTMWDFPGQRRPLASVGRVVYERGGVVAAVCHGPAALTTIKLSDGNLLVEREEHRRVHRRGGEGHPDGHPWCPSCSSRSWASGLRRQAHRRRPVWQEHVVTDGRLVTGQNPASAAGVGRAIIAALG